MATANRARSKGRAEQGGSGPRAIGPRTRELAGLARGSVGDLRLAAQLQLQEYPYLTLGGTFALGWVLGGGIPFGVVKWGLFLGARMATTTLVQAALKDATENLMGGRSKAFNGEATSDEEERFTAEGGNG